MHLRESYPMYMMSLTDAVMEYLDNDPVCGTGRMRSERGLADCRGYLMRHSARVSSKMPVPQGPI